MKNCYRFITLFMVSPFVFAGSPGDFDSYFSSQDPALTSQEEKSLAISEQWRNPGHQSLEPAKGDNGAVIFMFGSQQPGIVCAVLQICDIQLQPGERINGFYIGDQVRWEVAPAITGRGAFEIEHILVKPKDVGLDTTMIVTTDRRTYNFRLRSHRTRTMTTVAFKYPDETQQKWDAFIARRQQQEDIRKTGTIPETGEYLGDLDFLYTVTGSASWKPLRVYNDGRKTIIQMPTEFAQKEAPVLMVLHKAGGVFTEEETGLINYRLQGDRYIVDAVFDQAVLISGVGKNQDRITISRSNEP